MTCPICKRPTEARWRPFCSQRCADVDLGRWVSGGYAIPTEEAPSDETPASGDGAADRDPGPITRH